MLLWSFALGLGGHGGRTQSTGKAYDMLAVEFSFFAAEWRAAVLRRPHGSLGRSVASRPGEGLQDTPCHCVGMSTPYACGA
eukprot:598872-Pyramimonas_sp.AAC.1